MLHNIRHIIFDLGGVLLNIDYQLTESAFENLGITDFKAHYSQLRQTTLFDDFETGKISEEDFIERIQQISEKTLTEEQIVRAWNAMLLDFPLRRLQILQQLQIHFDTFLLSNTNSIHEKCFHDILKSQTGFSSLGVFFDRVFYSHRIGLRKPDHAAFQLILDQHQISPERTLFIDDSPQHIAAAKELGIQTVWLQKGMSIEKDIFREKSAP
jgi:epoxide hydrolase-like predicted phosphatase